MTYRVRYPSDDFPPLPSVAITVPDNWASIHAPDVLLAAGAPVEEGIFRANVVVTASRMPAGFDVDTAAESVRARFADLPNVAEIGHERRTVLGHPGFRYEGAYSTDDGFTLVQLVHVAVFERGSMVDMVQLTATCSAGQALDILIDLREILDSATLEE